MTQEPATKADIAALRNEVALKTDLTALENRMQAGFVRLMRHIDKQTGSLYERVDQVLAVLVNMDKRLTGGIAQHEKRITRLEEHTGLSVR
ncbi:MAG: hypothetical protein AAB853_01585 [Patescibacteria group bacterium]